MTQPIRNLRKAWIDLMEFFENPKFDEEPLPDAKPDMVNNPPHYNFGGIECIDALQAALGPEGFKAYCRGACLKYLWRCEHKNGLEDLKKCRWYLNRLIDASLFDEI